MRILATYMTMVLAALILDASLLSNSSGGPETDRVSHRNPGAVWRWPLANYGPSRISQDYSEYEGYVSNKHHTGIDVYTDNVPAQVLAMTAGDVTLYVPNDVGCDASAHKCADHGDGNTIVERHENRLFSQYQHMTDIEGSLRGSIVERCKEIGPDTDKFGNARHYYRCKKGQVSLRDGQVLGHVGGSGFGIPDAWDIHLHFEVKQFASLNSPDDPYEWGYSTPHPHDIGYRDPVNYLEDTDGIVPVAHVVITHDGNGQPMTLGPNDTYAIALPAKENDDYYARRVASQTTGCKLGWFKLTKSHEYPPPKSDYFVTSKFAKLPDVWMCLGQDINHQWIKGF